jgi:hypothetical protein
MTRSASQSVSVLACAWLASLALPAVGQRARGPLDRPGESSDPAISATWAFSLRSGWIDIPPGQDGVDGPPYVMSLENGLFLAFWAISPGYGMITAFDFAGTRALDPTPLQDDGAQREYPDGDVFSDGGFVLAYRYYLAANDALGLRAQLFHPDLTKDGPEIVVGEEEGFLDTAEAIVLTDDTFVVAFENRSTGKSVLSRYDRDGDRIGDRWILPDLDVVVRIAALPTGGFAMAFQESWGGDTITRTYDPAFTMLTETRVDEDFSTSGSEAIQLVAFASGDFGVVGSDVHDYTVRVLRFGPDNALLATIPIAVAGFSSSHPSLTAIENGFFVTWNDQKYTIHGREFHASGLPAADALSLFAAPGTRIFIGETSGSRYRDTVYVTGYDLINNDCFLRRLTR